MVRRSESYRDNMKAGNFDMVFNICWGMPYDPQSSLAAMRAPVYGDFAAQQGLADKKEIDQAITDILTTTDEEERQGTVPVRSHPSPRGCRIYSSDF